MNCISSTYCQASWKATSISTFVDPSSTNEGNASGFTDSKAQRERFAKPLILHSSSSGKERDAETGYGYFGARYMDHELMTMWLSVDPLADKYQSMSPYNYCANNPVKLVDPDGDSVVVKGNQADRLVSQLQTSNMEVSRSDCGKLSVDLHGNAVSDLSKEELKIYKAITNTKVSVNITAQETSLIDGKHVFKVTTDGVSETYECPFGGSNLGAFFDRNAASAISFGMVDMNMLEANRYDQGVAHEVSELFVAGLIALRDQSDVPMAIQGKTNPRMVEAHNMAIPAVLENGGIYQSGIKFGQLGKIKFNPFDILNIIQ